MLHYTLPTSVIKFCISVQHATKPNWTHHPRVGKQQHYSNKYIVLVSPLSSFVHATDPAAANKIAKKVAEAEGAIGSAE